METEIQVLSSPADTVVYAVARSTKQKKRQKTKLYSVPSMPAVESALETTHEVHLPLCKQCPLLWRKIVKQNIGWVSRFLFGWGIVELTAFIVVEGLSDHSPGFARDLRSALTWIWVCALLTLVAVRFGYAALYLIRYFYDADDRNLVIRKGVIARREIILPFSRVTDVYVDQDFLDWVFGLYDVHVSTPTRESGSFAHVDGVSKREAEIIRAIILSKIHRLPGARGKAAGGDVVQPH